MRIGRGAKRNAVAAKKFTVGGQLCMHLKAYNCFVFTGFAHVLSESGKGICFEVNNKPTLITLVAYYFKITKRVCVPKAPLTSMKYGPGETFFITIVIILLLPLYI